MADVAKIKEVVGLIELWEKQPGSGIKFDMGSWYQERTPPPVVDNNWCGTSVCFAGAAVIHARIPVRRTQLMDGHYDQVETEDGTVRFIEDWAREYLGLNHGEADSIFYSTHVENVTELKSLINYETGQEIFEGVPTWVDPAEYDDEDDEDEGIDDVLSGCQCSLCA